MFSSFSSLGRNITNKMSVIYETNRTHYYRFDDTDLIGSTIKNIVDGTYSLNITGPTSQISALYTNTKNGRNSCKISASHYANLITPVNLYSNDQTVMFKFIIGASGYNTTQNNYIFLSNYNSNTSLNGYLHFNVVGANIELAYTFENPSTLKTTLVSNLAIGGGRFYSFAIVRNGSTSIDFYIDGLLVTSISNSTNYKIFNNSSNNNFYLGRNPNQAYYYTGFTDDTRFYSRALSASEIAVIHSSCLS